MRFRFDSETKARDNLRFPAPEYGSQVERRAGGVH
jgi:hypothetical protein